MSSYLRQAAEALPNPGTTGSWSRRFVEGVVDLGTWDGATVGALSGTGGWLQQLYLALDPRPSYAGSNWIQKLSNGGGPELVAMASAEAEGPDGDVPEGALFHGNFRTGTYYDGDVATVDDIVIEDLVNWEAFDPDTEIVEGIGLQGDPALSAAGLAMVLAGATLVFVFDSKSVDLDFEIALGNGVIQYNAHVTGSGAGADTRVRADALSTEVYYTPTRFGVGLHIVAFNIADGKMVMSVDGGAAVAADPADVWDELEYLGWRSNPNRHLDTISVTIYTLADDVDLPDYSVPTWPINTVLPVISGTEVEESLLTVSNGTWDKAVVSYAYQWLDDDAEPIEGATSATYLLTGDDVGGNISCSVYATNAEGAGLATSEETGEIASLAPANTVLPEITGAAEVGETLSCSTGTWTNNPSGYVYQWFSVDPYANLTELGEFPTYEIQAAEEGLEVACYVAATNAYGTGEGVNAEAVGPVAP